MQGYKCRDFSTTATFSKVQLQKPFKGMVRETRYRETNMNEFLAKEERQALRISQLCFVEQHDVFRTHFIYGESVYGYDMHLCDASRYTESHFDVLHIYYNSFSDYQLNPKIYSAKEVTHNYSDKKQNLPHSIHNDGVWYQGKRLLRE
ncbi:hypothetical protein [Kangiella sp.]|uniref:hypothetical protein n=1 Tax=Gammaproteobacteria TaxID=1236 RepID=UPI003A8F0AFF